MLNLSKIEEKSRQVFDNNNKKWVGTSGGLVTFKDTIWQHEAELNFNIVEFAKRAGCEIEKIDTETYLYGFSFGVSFLVIRFLLEWFIYRKIKII